MDAIAKTIMFAQTMELVYHKIHVNLMEINKFNPTSINLYLIKINNPFLFFQRIFWKTKHSWISHHRQNKFKKNTKITFKIFKDNVVLKNTMKFDSSI